MIAGIIVYGSLYPFAFRVPINGPGPIPALLKTWADRPGRGDLISNILLYLGFALWLLLAATPRLGAPVIARLLVIGLVAALGPEETRPISAPNLMWPVTDDLHRNAVGGGS